MPRYDEAISDKLDQAAHNIVAHLPETEDWAEVRAYLHDLTEDFDQTEDDFVEQVARSAVESLALRNFTDWVEWLAKDLGRHSISEGFTQLVERAHRYEQIAESFGVPLENLDSSLRDLYEPAVDRANWPFGEGVELTTSIPATPE